MATAALLLVVAPTAHGTLDPGSATAPRSEFVAPPAGTYRLQRIQSTSDAELLDGSNRIQHLSRFMHGKVTLLTFFYTYCVDPLGCPFAHMTLAGLRARLLMEPRLASAVRFVNVSLDPTTDTPAAITQYAAQFATDSVFEWRFLTARSVSTLLPVLEDFGQDVSVEMDERGRPTRTLHHMLKVFLIDRKGIVREIYSLAYLQPDVMFNDIQTLFLEDSSLNGGRVINQGAPAAPPIECNVRTTASPRAPCPPGYTPPCRHRAGWRNEASERT